MRIFKCSYQRMHINGVCYIFAQNIQDAKNKMAKKALLVTNIHEVRFLTHYGNKTQELERIFWQLGFGYTSGLSLIDILQSIKSELYFKDNITLIQSMIYALEHGSTLSSALKKHSDICGNLVLALFAIGEKSGFLQETCELCAKEIAQKNAYNLAIRKAMIYPFILASTFLCVFVVLALFVIPEFAQLYNELGANLPLSTSIVISICNFFQTHIFELFGCIGIFALLCVVFLRQQALKDNLLLHIPFFNKVVVDYQLYIYFLGLHYFLKSKVPFTTSIQQCNKLLHNSVLYKKFMPLETMLNNGIPLSQAFNNLDIQIANISLLQSGEQSGMLDKALELNSTFYKNNFTQSLQILQILMQPIATMVVGVLIAGLAYSIVSPMWQLLEVAM